MEITSRAQVRQNPSPTTSPNRNTNGLHIQTRPQTPQPISRSEHISFPTTIIQADTTSFKQLVQTLTGTSQTSKQASKHSSPIPRLKTGQKKQSSFKRYERRNNLKNGLTISSPTGQNLTRKDFPSLTLSPVTPLIEDPFGKPSLFTGNSLLSEVEKEEKAIAEKGFYLHPSLRTGTQKGSKPLLLPLFPVTLP